MKTWAEKIIARFPKEIQAIEDSEDMLTIAVSPAHLLLVCQALCHEPEFLMNQLIDVCGIDYQDYGVSHWRTQSTTATGFSRGVDAHPHHAEILWDKPRFASIYHLLSLPFNQRLRIKVYLPEEALCVPSVYEVWPAANWFEREAFDLFGIIYENHPDLRRILTDYGFKGHPFRKDFPLIGEVELRYDAKAGRCVYGPVSIQPRVLVPKVIRQDHRYEEENR